MEKDFDIIRIGWLTKRVGRLQTDKQIHTWYCALIDFLQNHGLTTHIVLLEDAVINDDSCLKRSDLTDLGFEVYRRAEKKWFNGHDKGRALNDMRAFEKELAKLMK